MLIHDWKKEPLKYDPSRGYMLCQSCWNGQHWDPPCWDVNGVFRHKTSNCLLSKFKGLGGCECGCTDPGPKKVKFTGRGSDLHLDGEPDHHQMSSKKFILMSDEAWKQDSVTHTDPELGVVYRCIEHRCECLEQHAHSKRPYLAWSKQRIRITEAPE